MKDKLWEECEAKLWTIVYEIHGKGLSYEQIKMVVSDFMLPDLAIMTIAEKELKDN